MAEVTFRTERPLDETALRLTSEGFGQLLDDKFAVGAIAVLDACDGFVSAIDGDETIGYIGYRLHSVLGEQVVYAATIMIDGGVQGRGTAGELMRRAAEANSVDYVGLRTQSARMYAAAKKMYSQIRPDLDGDFEQKDELWLLGDALPRQRNLDTFPVAQGAYGASSMYAERQEHSRYPQFYDVIDFEAGDALFCIGRL